MVESQAGCAVPDDEHPLAVARARHLVEEASDPLDRLPPALSLRERLVEVLEAHRVELRPRHAVQRAVVALAESGVAVDGDLGPGEGDLGGLDGSRELRGEDGSGVVVAAALAERLGLTPSGFG